MITSPFSTTLTVSPSTMPLSYKTKIRLSDLKSIVRMTCVLRNEISAAAEGAAWVAGAGAGVCFALAAVRCFAGITTGAGEAVVREAVAAVGTAAAMGGGLAVTVAAGAGAAAAAVVCAGAGGGCTLAAVGAFTGISASAGADLENVRVFDNFKLSSLLISFVWVWGACF